MSSFSVASSLIEDALLINKDRAMKEIFEKQSRLIEGTITHQLNEFISRGLIVVERTHSSLVRLPGAGGVEMREAIQLKLKDQEYIERLESENKTLKEALSSIESALKVRQ